MIHRQGRSAGRRPDSIFIVPESTGRWLCRTENVWQPIGPARFWISAGGLQSSAPTL